MKHTVRLLALLLVLCVAAVGLFAFTSGVSAPKSTKPILPATASGSAVPAPKPPEPVPEPEPENAVVRLKAVGDNLIHDSIYKQAAKHAGGNGFDFGPCYQAIEGLVADADLSYINQETIIAEKLYPLSGYPRFNSPEAVGEHMVKIGFDVVGIANNHMLDMGEEGLRSALDFWEAQRVTVFGAWRTEEKMQEPIITEKNGIRIGWVPVTEHTNGLKLPAETSFRYLLTSEDALVKQQIERTRANADFVIVVPHWGTEYSLDANSNQIELAQRWADWGVDLVLGSHPHTLQPMEWRTGSRGNRTLVVYSLGNLVGSMLYPQNMLGGMLDIDITKDGATGKTSITRAKLIPTVIQYEGLGTNLRVYPFADYTEELAASHGLVQLAALYDVTIGRGVFTTDYLRGILQKNIPAEFLSAGTL